MEKFMGFSEPTENWSKLPHEFIAAMDRVSSLAEMKVILYILRHTWGYQDDSKKITVDEFCNGRKKRDGSRIDNGTGMSENAVRDGIKRAVDDGFIVVAERDESDKGRIKVWYALAMKDDLGVQKLNPWPSEVEPRTEKETKKETSSTAEKPSAVTRSLKVNLPKSITDSGEGKNKTTKTRKYSEDDPIAVQAYYEVCKRLPPKESFTLIQEAIGNRKEDLAFWKDVVRNYISCGWNPRNVVGMIEWYKRRELPRVGREERKGEGDFSAWKLG